MVQLTATPQYNFGAFANHRDTEDNLEESPFEFTEETLGKAERTELDPHLVMLEQKTDNCKVKKKWLID